MSERLSFEEALQRYAQLRLYRKVPAAYNRGVQQIHVYVLYATEMVQQEYVLEESRGQRATTLEAYLQQTRASISWRHLDEDKLAWWKQQWEQRDTRTTARGDVRWMGGFK